MDLYVLMRTYERKTKVSLCDDHDHFTHDRDLVYSLDCNWKRLHARESAFRVPEGDEDDFDGYDQGGTSSDVCA